MSFIKKEYPSARAARAAFRRMGNPGVYNAEETRSRVGWADVEIKGNSIVASSSFYSEHSLEQWIEGKRKLPQG